MSPSCSWRVWDQSSYAPHTKHLGQTLHIVPSCTQKNNPTCKPLTFWPRSRHAWSQRGARREVSWVRFCTGSHGQHLGFWGSAHHQTFPSHTHGDEAASWTEAHANWGSSLTRQSKGLEHKVIGPCYQQRGLLQNHSFLQEAEKRYGQHIWGDFCGPAPWIGSRALAIFTEGCGTVTQTYI